MITLGVMSSIRRLSRGPFELGAAEAVGVLSDSAMVQRLRKAAGDPAAPPAPFAAPGGDDTPFVFSGSLVVGGRAYARVVRTGARTEIGKIGLSADGRVFSDGVTDV